MRPALLALALLVASPSSAGDVTSSRPDSPRRLHLRLHQLGAGGADVQEVLVAGGASTIITTPWRLNPRGTGVAGRGERPFEVLLGAQRAVVTPTRHLVPGERWPLVLRLSDDSVVPLVLVAAPEGQRPDREVAVDFDNSEEEQLRVQLAAVTERALGLEERLRQALREQDSEDFALAGLLASGKANLTAMREVRGRQLVSDARGRIDLLSYVTSERHGPRKVAVVIQVVNRGAEPMTVAAKDFYGRETLARPPIAARAVPTVIAPGARGVLSVVADLSSADLGEEATLELGLQRGGKRSELPVYLVADDFATGWRPF